MRHSHRPLSNKYDFTANLDKIASDRWEAVEGNGSKKVITSKSLSLCMVYTRQLRGCRVQVAKKHRAVREVVNSGARPSRQSPKAAARSRHIRKPAVEPPVDKPAARRTRRR